MKLFGYPEQRALEDAAYGQGMTPTRLIGLMLPVWCVTISATVTVAEDYELIDRFLERGIAEGGLTTTADLAGFYALDEVLVDRALRFLALINHVRLVDGHWALTDLGKRSVADGRRYVRLVDDRRKLYFDAFRSRPLTRAYYDARKVSMLPAHKELEDDARWFRVLFSVRGFDPGALTALAGNPQRDRFNLPARIENPRLLGQEQVLLPLRVVRAVEAGGRVRYLAYGQASAEVDWDLTGILESTPDVLLALENEERVVDTRGEEERTRAWLDEKDVGPYHLTRSAAGLMTVAVPESGVGQGGFPLHRLGSFVVHGSSVFRLWCAAERPRRQALLDRVVTYVIGAGRVDTAHLTALISRIGRQLELDISTVADLAALAEKAGARDLADRLRDLD
ncbi:hypothetical protein V5P93_002394 [Actinokineospora auranticolor]|uniref:Uncharacterized protein n=1 Tax=Actinokineospora auranticolor TaxID=155976 RepID=A0A2S6GC13_9PSEU|nr:hypothetical protein [Actinokineospora auranticolor]PPK61870.1 hypothetical protein CLV40_13818 [Actinokineospora auranticolor]